MPGRIDPQPKEVVEEMEVIRIGDSEYKQEELERLVGLGKIAQEAETKYDTKIDRVWPKYNENLRELQQAKQELEQLKQQAQTKVNQGELPDVAIEEAKQAARKLGIVLQEDFDKALEQAMPRHYAAQRQGEKLVDELTALESEIDGKDGRPKFNKEEILQYMAETGFRKPMDAYENKYKAQTDEWRANQLLASKKGGFYSASSSSVAKQPPVVKVNHNNLQSLIAEALNLGGDE